MSAPSRSSTSRRLAALQAVCGLVCLLAIPLRASAQALSQMSLEDLLNVEVTSVSRRSQKLSETAAATSVLTSEDIRRSGARTIPDVLRLVPGVHVGQIDSNKWSVSVRGFAGRFSNKLLVLVDGRSIYTPLFSGVFWNLVDIPLDNVERIEIIRGPGATLWGANAVNGVINIITRSAPASHGVLVTSGSGSEDRAFGAVRAGFGLGPHAAVRFDLGGADRAGFASSADRQHIDSWVAGSTGMRLDAELSPRQDLEVQSGYVTSDSGEQWRAPSFAAPYMAQLDGHSRYASGFTMARWTLRADQGTTAIQFIDQHDVVKDLALLDSLHTVDVEFQYSRRVGAHETLLGATYRSSRDASTPTSFGILSPASRRLQMWSGFLQDDVAMGGGRVHVTAGLKFEHNDYTGWEVQPNVRALVRMSARQTVWAAVSRAVRLPSRAESDAVFRLGVVPPSDQVPVPQFLVYEFDGTPKAEVLVAYEGGYRVQPRRAVSFDLSVYRNRYRDLFVIDGMGQPALSLEPVPHVDLPVFDRNAGSTSAFGAELSTDWHPTARARVTGAYSWYHSGSAVDINHVSGRFSGYPAHQLQARGVFSLPRQVELDLSMRHVSAIEQRAADGGAGQRIAAYTEADLRLGLHLGRTDISFIGRNLLSPAHFEYLPEVIDSTSARVQRSATVRLTWKF